MTIFSEQKCYATMALKPLPTDRVISGDEIVYDGLILPIPPFIFVIKVYICRHTTCVRLGYSRIHVVKLLLLLRWCVRTRTKDAFTRIDNIYVIRRVSDIILYVYMHVHNNQIVAVVISLLLYIV